MRLRCDFCDGIKVEGVDVCKLCGLYFCDSCRGTDEMCEDCDANVNELAELAELEEEDENG